MSALPTSATASATAPQARGVGRTAGWIDPVALMRIKSLQLRAKLVVEGFFSGLHRSPYHGFSVEFSEYRPYTMGDDPRYLDWRLLARTDRYYIKRFEDETNLRCYLLVDLSRSMGYGSLDWTKADYARTAAATLAYFLNSQRDAVGLLTFESQIADYLPARHRPGHLQRLLICLERAVAGKSTDLAAPLEQVTRTVRKRGLVVLISDLLAPTAALQRYLGQLRSRGHEVVVMRVLDPAELTFQFHDPALFQDVETGRELYVDPDVVRANYLARFNEHDECVRKACRDQGIEYLHLPTDRPLELALFDFVRSRLHQVSRAGASRTARQRRRS